MRKSLPVFAADAIIEAMPVLGKKLKGFDREDAKMTAVESRSSSPVRIERDESGQSCIRGLFPSGEGAGYAGRHSFCCGRWYKDCGKDDKSDIFIKTEYNLSCRQITANCNMRPEVDMSVKDELLFDFAVNMPRVLVTKHTAVLDNVRKLMTLTDSEIVVLNGLGYTSLAGKKFCGYKLER